MHSYFLRFILFSTVLILIFLLKIVRLFLKHDLFMKCPIHFRKLLNCLSLIRSCMTKSASSRQKVLSFMALLGQERHYLRRLLRIRQVQLSFELSAPSSSRSIPEKARDWWESYSRRRRTTRLRSSSLTRLMPLALKGLYFSFFL